MTDPCVAIVGGVGERRVCGAPSLPPDLRHDPAWPLCPSCEGARRGVHARWGKQDAPAG